MSQRYTEVFTLTLQEAQYHRNTCPQYILHQRGLPTKVGTRIWNHLQLLLPHHQHFIQTNLRCRETSPLAVLHTDVGGGPTGSTTTLDLVSPQTRCEPSNEWAHTTSHSYNTRSGPTNHSWRTTCAVQPPKPGTQGAQPVLEQAQTATATEPTAREPGPPPATGASGICTWCHGASGTPPSAQQAQSHIAARQSRGQLVDATTTHGAPLLSAATVARQADGDPHHLVEMWAPRTGHPMPTAHATPEQHRWLHTHFKQAAERDTATVAWGPNARAEGRFHPGTWDTQQQAITFLVLAKHCSATPEDPAYPVKHRCSQVQDWRMVEWTTFHPQTAYLFQYVYDYLTQGHERNNDYVRMNPAATEILRQGTGVYATRRLRQDAYTPLATTEWGAHIHAYQPTMPCGLPHPKNHNTIIFADASGTTSLTKAAGWAALELKVHTKRRLLQHHLTGATIFGAPSDVELETLAIVVDAVNDTNQEPHDHTHHVWVVVDAAVDFRIVRRLARQPVHKATDSSLGTQAPQLWTSLWHLPKHVVLHLVKQESHRYSLGNRHIDLHAHNQLAEHTLDG